MTKSETEPRQLKPIMLPRELFHQVTMAKFSFTDLHGFKDYVGFVRLCAPDQFPLRDYLKEDEQMNLERAFEGLRYGLDLTAREKGESPVVSACRGLVEEAYVHYSQGRMKEGYRTLEEMEKRLREVPSK